MYCVKCGNKLEPKTTFCTKCGNKIETKKDSKKDNVQNKTCLNCGNKLEKEATFCTKCGNKIETKKDSKKDNTKNKFCLNCGNKLEEDATVCPKCKTKVGSNKNKEENKIDIKKQIQKNKKTITIVGAIIVALLAIFLLKFINDSKPIKENWGEKYYLYLKEIKSNQKQINIKENIQNGKLSFLDINDIDNPVMVYTYQKNNTTYTNIYYIRDDKVNSINIDNDADIEFLYNLEDKKYDYYIHTGNEKNDFYTKIQDKINNKFNANYTISKEDSYHGTNNGKEVNLSKKDETFIKPKITNKEVNFNIQSSDLTIKKKIKNSIKKYQKQTKIIADVKKEVAKVEKEIKEKQKIKNSDWARFTELFTEKIINSSCYDYTILDIDNDELPELLTRSSNSKDNWLYNFRIYKIKNNELTEIYNQRLGYIYELSLGKYNQKNIYVVDSFSEAYQNNGKIIDYAYILDNKYVEYSRNISIDLDTLDNSEIVKTTVDIKTSETDRKTYPASINKEASDYKDSVTNDDYNKEIKELQEKTTVNEKVEFHQNSFSEWEHDSSKLKDEVTDILNNAKK